MNKLLFLCFALSLIAGSAGQAEDWTLPRGNERLTNSTPEKAALPLSLAWQFQTAPFVGNPSQPIVLGQTVIFSTGDRIIALDTMNGSRKWTYPSASEPPLGAQIRSSLAADAGKVFFGANDGMLYCISATDGQFLWRYATLSPIRSSPIVWDGKVFIGSDDDALHCVDASTGESLWPGGFRTMDDVATPAAVDGGMVYFLSRDSYIYAANAQTGRLRWRERLMLPSVNAYPVIAENYMYLGMGNILMSKFARSGARQWQITMPAEIAAPPAYDNRILLVPLRNRRLYAVTAQGRGLWPQPVDTVYPARTTPLIAGDVFFQATDRGVISAYDIQTGQLQWRYVLEPTQAGDVKLKVNGISAPLVWANGALFVLPDDGTLSAFRPEAPDFTPPTISDYQPYIGQAVNGSPPLKISAVVTDSGSGINESSIILTLNGNAVEHKYEAGTGTVSYVTPVAETLTGLQNGRQELVLTVSDWKNNQATARWSFIVDNTLPAPRLKPVAPPKAPASPRSTRGSRRATEQPPASMDATVGGDSMPPPPPPPPPSPGGPEGPIF